MRKGKGILRPLQVDILRAFARLPDSDKFYLTGGTALAEFYFGHRHSFDLDLFTGVAGLVLPFSRTFEAMLPSKLAEGTSVAVIRRFESLVEFEIKNAQDEIRVQLAMDSPFRFNTPEMSEYGVFVNNLEDITVDKLLAYFGRAEARDAVDLYFILKEFDIQILIERAKKKDTGFDLYWMAVALEKVTQLPDDIRRWPVSMIADIDVRQLKETLSGMATQLMNQIRASRK